MMDRFRGEEGMAGHPATSEVKDVEGDGVRDIFRCRSEHGCALVGDTLYVSGGCDEGAKKEQRCPESLTVASWSQVERPGNSVCGRQSGHKR